MKKWEKEHIKRKERTMKEFQLYIWELMHLTDEEIEIKRKAERKAKKHKYYKTHMKNKKERK